MIWGLSDIASGDSDPYLRQQAISALKDLGPDSAPALKRLLRNKNFDVFQQSAWALQSMGGNFDLNDISSYLESIVDDPQRGPYARNLLGKAQGKPWSPPDQTRPGEANKEEKKSEKKENYIFITPSED